MRCSLRILTLLVLTQFWIISMRAQNLILNDSQPYLSAAQVKELLVSSRKLFLDYGIPPETKAMVIKLDTCYYLFPDGYNYVFQWQSPAWKNLYKGKFHGSNFNSFKFVYQGVIYSYGGFGFMHFHPEVTFFDRGKGEWEIIRWDGDKPKIEGKSQDLTFISGHHLYTYFNYQLVLRQQLDYEELNTVYRFDLDAHVWEKAGKLQPDFQTTTRYMVHAADYLAFISDEGNTAIISKLDLRYKQGILLASIFPKRNAVPDRQPPITQHVCGNKIYFFQDTTPYSQVDLDSVYRAHDMRTRSILQPALVLNKKVWMTGLFVLVVLSVTGIARSSGTRSARHEPSDLEKTYPSLFDHINQTIDLETLDRCLHLDDSISMNSRRNKRSQIIKELNQNKQFPLSIERVRNPLDRRIYAYRIEKKNKSGNSI